MCPERTLKRRNVDTITTNSVTSDEIGAQQRELSAAERILRQTGDRVIWIKAKVTMESQRLADARRQYRSRNTKQTQRVFNTAATRLQKVRRDRDKLISEYRELKLIVRDQRNMLRSLEKKETAKQEAVARFLKEWERNYDRKMRMKQKTIQKRKHLV